MEKKVLDFLIYLGKETSINVDMSSITKETQMETNCLEEADTTICLPAEVYSVGISLADSLLAMKLRYCPSEICKLIVTAEIITKEGENECEIAKNVAVQFRKVAPDIPVQITKI